LNLPTDDGAQLLRGGGRQQTCSSCLIFLALVAMVRCSQYPACIRSMKTWRDKFSLFHFAHRFD
jgi:hypothetical protein